MIKLFGIPNCDTCKKARRWLDEAQLMYVFTDVRQTALDAKTLDGWIQSVSWEKLLNRRSTTWRTLDEQEKCTLTPRKVRSLIQKYPTLMKRPVITKGRLILVGFDPRAYIRLRP